MKKVIMAVAALVLVGVAGVAGYTLVKEDTPASDTAATVQTEAEQKTSKEISYQGVEGENALTLLKQSHKAETKSYEGLGELVTSIDGVAADSKHFWAFYVNGQQSQVGASSYITKKGDTLQWKLEEIK